MPIRIASKSRHSCVVKRTETLTNTGKRVATVRPFFFLKQELIPRQALLCQYVTGMFQTVTKIELSQRAPDPISEAT